jgi:hypothetical protein
MLASALGAAALSTGIASAAGLGSAAPVTSPASASAAHWAGWTSQAKAFLWPVGVHRPAMLTTPTTAALPDQNTYNNLIFHGGVVMHHPKVYLIFWGTQWKAGFRTGPNNMYSQATAINYETKFFANIGGTKWAGTQTQYCDGIAAGAVTCSQQQGAHYISNPSHVLKGVWIDSSAAPAEIVTSGLATNLVQDPIAMEAVKASQHFHTSDLDSLFMVFVPPNTIATGYPYQGVGAYCAYHSEVTNPTGHGIRYAFMPFTPEQTGGCGGNSVNSSNDAFGHGWFDSYTLAGGHEFEEAVTDPDAYPFQDGWNDYQTSENGDKCAYFHSADITLGKYYFAVQPLWSNEGNHGIGGCAFARGAGPEPIPPVTQG